MFILQGMHDDVIINAHTNYYKDQFIPLDTPYKAASIHIGSVTSIAAFDFIAFPTVPCHITQVQRWRQDLRTGGLTLHWMPSQNL